MSSSRIFRCEVLDVVDGAVHVHGDVDAATATTPTASARRDVDLLGSGLAGKEHRWPINDSMETVLGGVRKRSPRGGNGNVRGDVRWDVVQRPDVVADVGRDFADGVALDTVLAREVADRPGPSPGDRAA